MYWRLQGSRILEKKLIDEFIDLRLLEGISILNSCPSRSNYQMKTKLVSMDQSALLFSFIWKSAFRISNLRFL